MSVEPIQAEAPVSDAPVSEPAPVDTSSEVQPSSFEASFEKVHDQIEPPRESNGQYRKPPEWKPEASPEIHDEAQELEAPEPEQQGDIQPPPNWKSRGDIWSKLPAEAKALVVQREQEVQRGVSQLGEQAKTAREISQVFEQYRETAPKLADGRSAPPTQVMEHLLAANDALERNPAEALQWLARHYGVELGGQAEQQFDPAQETQRLLQQVQDEALRSFQAQQQREQQQQWQQQAQQLGQYVERFASERAEQWPQIEQDVLYHIAAIRSVSPELSPQEALSRAYDKALAGRPDLDSTKKAETKKRADEARRISSMNIKSIGGAIARSGGNWQDDLGRIYDSIQTRGR